MNLQQLKAKYAAKETATTTTAVTTTKTADTSTIVEGPGLFSRAMKSTVNVTVAVAKTTRGVMPVSTRRFENIVEGLNDKHENTDRELFKNKVMIHMIASAVGVNLPTDAELDKLYEEYDKYEDEGVLEQIEAIEEEMAKQEEVIEQVEEAVEEVAATEEKPEKEKKSSGGRRRLGRQKPIAE